MGSLGKNPFKKLIPLALALSAFGGEGCAKYGWLGGGNAPAVNAVAVQQNSLSLAGTGLSLIHSIRFNDPSLSTYSASIVSQSDNNLVINMNSNSNAPFALVVGVIYSLTVSSAYASTTVSISVAMPAGAVMAFNLSACPTGWSAMDGTSGNPDVRGRTIIGSGSGTNLTPRNLLDSGGEETHTLALSEIPSHTHSLNVSNGDGTIHVADSGSVLASSLALDGSQTSSYNTSAANTSLASGSIGTAGGGTAHNVMNPYLSLLYCIKN